MIRSSFAQGRECHRIDKGHRSTTRKLVNSVSIAQRLNRECDGILQPGVKFAPRTKPQVARRDCSRAKGNVDHQAK